MSAQPERPSTRAASLPTSPFPRGAPPLRVGGGGGRGQSKGEYPKFWETTCLGGTGGGFGETGGQLLMRVNGCPQPLPCRESGSPHFGVQKRGLPFESIAYELEEEKR